MNESTSLNADTIIELRNITKHFPKRGGGIFTAIDSFSARINSGEFVSIIGPSGCGKTTLLKIADGLIPHEGGSVIIEGRVTTSPGPDRAMVFQDFALMPWATALQNVSFPLEVNGVSKSKARTSARAYLELVGLQNFADNYPHELSGGMQQRVGLARSLIAEPKILLMDEPFGALDAQTRRELQNELLEIWRSSGQRTVIFVTHSMDEAVYLSDRILIMANNPGRLHEELTIALPRPRSEAIRKEAKFVELTEYVWEVLSTLGDSADNSGTTRGADE